MQSNKLSNSEEIMMHIFWQQNKPLTSVDILRLAQETAWSSNYVHKILGLLQKKGLLSMCGVEKDKNHYVRKFEPTMTKEDYLAGMLAAHGVETSSLAKIAVALVKKQKKPEDSQKNQDLIEELEEMLRQFEEQEDA